MTCMLYAVCSLCNVYSVWVDVQKVSVKKKRYELLGLEVELKGIPLIPGFSNYGDIVQISRYTPRM